MSLRAFAVAAVSVVFCTGIAGAQQGGAIPRVGILDPYVEADSFNEQLRRAFRDTGLIEGRNVHFEWLYADGDISRLPALAVEMTRQKLAAIVTVGDPSTRQAAPATQVVAGSDDLVGEGHVASLGRSGGNVTGVSILSSELNAKRLEQLKLAVPSVTRVGVLWDPDTGTFHLDALRRVAANLEIELKIEEVRRLEDLDRVFAEFSDWRANGLNVLASPLLHALRQPIIERAARGRLPAIYQWDETAAVGGLMSYGPTHREVLLGMARQLDRVLKGTKAGDIPVEQPTQFKLVINMKTAKALGLTLSPSVLASADEVIE